MQPCNGVQMHWHAPAAKFTVTQQATQPLPGYIEPDAPDYAQHFEAAKERFSNYFDVPEKYGQKEVLADMLAVHDPKAELVGYYMSSEYGPQIVEALAAEPHVIPYLLSLPRPQQAREMAKLEGYLAAQQMQQQNAAYQEPQPRRTTAAPPPIRSPRGAANPPSDLHNLARRDNVDDYVRVRQKQNYQDWKDRQGSRYD